MLGCGFVIAMFFAPIFSSIPGYATGPALVVVGTMMLGHAREIDWDDMKVAFPSFLTVVLMPLSYSIAYGVLAGKLAGRCSSRKCCCQRWLPSFEGREGVPLISLPRMSSTGMSLPIGRLCAVFRMSLNHLGRMLPPSGVFRACCASCGAVLRDGGKWGAAVC